MVTTILSVPQTGSAAALWLRPWRLGDLPALVAAHRDPALRRWLAHSLADEAEARQWLPAQAAGWDSATRFSFAVVTGENDCAPVCHLVVKVGIASVAEGGYWTAAHMRGRAIAACALETVSQWALNTQRLVPSIGLDLLHAEDNRASCRVALPVYPAGGHRHVRTSPGSPCFVARL